MKQIALSVLCLGLGGCVISLKDEKPPKPLIEARLHYRYPGANELNTFDGTYKKQVADHRFAQTAITLAPEQQLLIVNKAVMTHFWTMPDSLNSGKSGEEQFIEIASGTMHHAVHWKGNLADLPVNPQREALIALMSYTDSIVRSTEAYQRLPETAEK